LRDDLTVAGVPTLFEGKHPITFHALRRTFMSLLEGEGVGRDLIGALAGHAGKTVTDRHYIAKNIERFNEAVKKLPLPDALAWLPQ
jgi:integrase